MYKDFKPHLEKEIINTKNSGLYKSERVIVSPQSSEINTKDQKEIINLNEFDQIFVFVFRKEFQQD